MCCIIRRISWNPEYSKHQMFRVHRPPVRFEQVNLGSIHRNKMLPWCYLLCNSHQSRHFASPNQASDLAPCNRFATILNHYKSAFFRERFFSLHCSIPPEGKVIPALSEVIVTYLFRTRRSLFCHTASEERIQKTLPVPKVWMVHAYHLYSQLLSQPYHKKRIMWLTFINLYIDILDLGPILDPAHFDWFIVDSKVNF